jgi:hypothetical protein
MLTSYSKDINTLLQMYSFTDIINVAKKQEKLQNRQIIWNIMNSVKVRF